MLLIFITIIITHTHTHTQVFLGFILALVIQRTMANNKDALCH